MKNLNYGQNIRSSEHLKMFDKKPVNKKIMKNILDMKKLKISLDLR